MSNSKLPGIIAFVLVAASLVAFYLNDRGQLSFGGADAVDHSTMDHSSMEHAGHGAESHDGFSAVSYTHLRAHET